MLDDSQLKLTDAEWGKAKEILLNFVPDPNASTEIAIELAAFTIGSCIADEFVERLSAGIVKAHARFVILTTTF